MVVLLSKMSILKNDYWSVLFLLIPIFIGIGVMFFMIALADGIKRAVDGIREVEKSLSLTQTAEYKPEYHRPLMFIVSMTVVMCIFFVTLLLLGG